MSTSCAIGMELPDGTIKAVRCHWDGYVAGVGTILAGWYNSPEKVETLLALGYLNEVMPKLEDCLATPRGRRMPKRFTCVEEYQQNSKGDMDAIYLYLYKDGKWYVHGLGDHEWTEINVTIGGQNG